MNNGPLIEIPISDNGSGLICADYMKGLIESISGSGLNIQLARAGDSLATRACNAFTNAFLRGKADELWILDCDIVTCAEHFKMLASHDVELVYGTYPKRHPRMEHCLAPLQNGDRPNLETPLWEVRRAGRGYTRIKRSLLEKMKEDNGGPALRYHNGAAPVEWDFWPSGPISGSLSSLGDGKDADGYPIREFISEDWGFCDRARALGVPVLVDWRIQTVHIGQCHFPIHYTADMLPAILQKFPDHVIEEQWNAVRDIRRPTMHWDQIRGWFDECNMRVYREIVDFIPNGGHFAEIGCWLGRSTAAFSAFMEEAKKEIEIVAVDTFRCTESEPCKSVQAAVLAELEANGHRIENGSFKKLFGRNMRACGVAVKTVEADSAKAAGAFPDGYFDAIYIDGDHSYEGCRADIAAWVPKVRKGGLITGDDYAGEFAGVIRAVNEAFGDRVRQVGRCWVVEKE